MVIFGYCRTCASRETGEWCVVYLYAEAYAVFADTVADLEGEENQCLKRVLPRETYINGTL